jgi:hypothetical protein
MDANVLRVKQEELLANAMKTAPVLDIVQILFLWKDR